MKKIYLNKNSFAHHISENHLIVIIITQLDFIIGDGLISIFIKNITAI